MFLEQDVDLVLLDMDGTLLDLHYDAHFWMEFIPEQYALVNQITLLEASHYVRDQYQQVWGSLSGYCYDYWTATLGLNIHQLQYEHKHKIQWREDTLWFLQKLKTLNKKIIILTNAHPSGIKLKDQQTQLLSYVDLVISSHDVGYPKEKQVFWSHVKKQLNTDFSRTVFMDDNENILVSAQSAGVEYVVGVNKPNSEKPAKLMRSFSSIGQFSELFK